MFSENLILPLFVHGGGHSSDGVTAYVEKFLALVDKVVEKLVILPTKNTDEIFTKLLPGINSLANIHPLFVHFPIALLTVFFIVDVLGSLTNNNAWRNTAGLLLYLGAISAIATVVAGLQAAATVPHSNAAHAIMMQHKMLGYTVASLAVLLSLWRLLIKEHLHGFANFLYLGVAALMCVALTLGADRGGLMVFNYGVGVSSTAPRVTSQHHGHSH